MPQSTFFRESEPPTPLGFAVFGIAAAGMVVVLLTLLVFGGIVAERSRQSTEAMGQRFQQGVERSVPLP